MNPSGIGWRHPHYAPVLEQCPSLGFLQVHSENFFGSGGAAIATLSQARERYPISLHGVGLSLGSATGLDTWHLNQLVQLVRRIEPVRVSDHACFARGQHPGLHQSQNMHAADLLPLPMTQSALDVLCANVQQAQEALRRPLLIENLSVYLEYSNADFSETGFLSALVQRTGCQLLLDVNNIYVNALNAQKMRFAPRDTQAAQIDCIALLDALPASSVGEIHLAGHCEMDDIVIDDHGSAVCEPVWQLYAHALRRFDDPPALIEWDTQIPPLQVLLDHVAQADALRKQAQAQIPTQAQMTV